MVLVTKLAWDQGVKQKAMWEITIGCINILAVSNDILMQHLLEMQKENKRIKIDT